MATLQFGTLSTLDTLKSNFQNVAEYGEDRAFEDFENLRQAHNRNWMEMAGSFVDRTTDRLRRYGGSVLMGMEKLDEFGTPHPQKVRAGSNVGFPLYLFGAALQWNRRYFLNATVAEWATQVESLFTADIANLIIEVKKALFTATNYFSTDPLVDNLGNTGLGTGVQLPVKALANADGAEIPVGPNGETFDGSTHTHYLFTATLTADGQTALIKTVAEHFAAGRAVIYINQAQETAYRALSGFVPYTDLRIQLPITSTTAPGKFLSPVDLFNRAIGIFGSAEVWVKPWVPSNYQVAVMNDQPAPLCMRTRNANAAGLELVSESDSHPLRARKYEHEFGIGAWNRVAAAVSYSNSGSAYASPTITGPIG